MPDFLSFINEILWGSVMIYLLLGAGIWFSWQTRGIQFRYVRKFGRSLKKSLHPQPGGLTSFQALCTSLAARVGSGNLAGVTLAIATGGPGAVFWMWVSALLGMASSFAECSLAQLYKERDSRGQFRGGPAWYMARGLGMRWMGVLFSILLLLAYGFIFNTVQANSVAHALRYAFDLPAAVSGGVLAVVVLLAILRGLRGVARLMQWIVPFMALLWIATSLLIGLWHITALPTIFATIFRCAFGWQEAAASWPPHPAAQGIVQMIGVFIDTIVICTASAIIVMLAPRPDNEYTLNGIQDLQHAMSVLVGGWGAGFIALIVLLFAFSSIVANYVYAENNLVFLRLDKPRYIWGLRILTVLMVLLGTMVSLPVVWQSADIIMALMAMTNLTAILLLSPTVRIIASDYLRQRRLGIQPTFDATRYPDIDQQLAPGAWNELPRE
ncbi:alanine/glycine:cation symporter family protein [Klebsiella pneumoniae]|uniref:alanine/glycine:cation symporter family protein n=1 Tax=Klebsiella pneumoniae TaxID=573 RepID=UPI0024ADF20A|nr:sodium:alanine symporter family protein [Klebsiella pneumoniae]HDO7126253.1 alanine:cation symporter family protein [Klebsiella pneumoniae]